ncbi:MAG: hypothetical protein O2910_07685 [Proteobacteria bacterium]|jgi:hypothetical protein|nr:hypothetical protein [Pseudomonadota bacterium]
MKFFGLQAGIGSFLAQNGIGGAFVALAHQFPLSELASNIGWSFALDALAAAGTAVLCTLF